METKKLEKNNVSEAVSSRNKPIMDQRGVDRSKELKITEEENDLENWKQKNWNKSKTVEQRKPMNSQVIHEISPESISCVISERDYVLVLTKTNLQFFWDTVYTQENKKTAKPLVSKST